MSAQPRWDDTAPAQRPVAVPASRAMAEPDRNTARIVSVIALASIAAGAINIAAAATIGGDNAQTHLFFGVVGAAQVVWGLLALVWAPRWWLALGALGNAVVVATWLVSRTVALPFGQFAHVVLPVRFPDSVATILAAVTVVGAAVLAVRGSGTARAAARVRGFALAAAVRDRRARPRRRPVADQRVRVRGWRRRPERPDRAQRWVRWRRRSGRRLRLLTLTERSGHGREPTPVGSLLRYTAGGSAAGSGGRKRAQSGQTNPAASPDSWTTQSAGGAPASDA